MGITMAWNLGNAMGDVIDHINARNTLLLEQKHSLAFLLAENRHQHIGAGNLALARALHVENSTLQNTLKPKRWLSFALFIVSRNKGCGGINKLTQIVPELVQIGTAGAQNRSSSFVVQQGQ